MEVILLLALFFVFMDFEFGGPISALSDRIRNGSKGKSSKLLLRERQLLLEEKKADIEEQRLKNEAKRLEVFDRALKSGDTSVVALLGKEDEDKSD